jgi:hypothetical protein
MCERNAMNITLSVDEQVARRARAAAQKMGNSLNQAVHDYLEQLGGGTRCAHQWAQFEERCHQSGAAIADWRFNRDEANVRRCMASAHASGCNVLLSEDLNAGEVIAGVKIVNPFANLSP